MSIPNQTKHAHELSSQLPALSLRISTESSKTRYNGELRAIERLYLQITGTPEAFRYLSTLLLELATNADSSVILDPAELKHLSVTEWSAVDIACCTELSDSKELE